MMWMEFKCETSLVVKTAETRQPFFLFHVSEVPRGLSDKSERGKSFFDFLDRGTETRI